MDRDGEIEGIIIKEFRQFDDNRGWLAELFRSDDPGEYRPEMGYVSLTYPGIVRGPHEHMEQTDYFCFLVFIFLRRYVQSISGIVIPQ
jgi:dTDP-4-dehydrorhamnose 3,5-epimerase